MAKKSTKDVSFAVWPTSWGPMGATAEAGGAVTRVVLPHYPADDLRDLLAWEHPNASESRAPFEPLIDQTTRYFMGERIDFADVSCAMPSESSFSGKVLRAARAIPYGQTRSYGQLAKEIGQPDAARAVATAMSKNPFPLVVPCHRVTYANGRPGGFSAEGGVALKQRLIDLEARRR